MSLIKTEINEKELSEVLNQWFNEHEEQILNNKNFCLRNMVAKTLKERLNKLGKWRYRARGDARKGRKVYLENQAKKEQINKDDNW